MENRNVDDVEIVPLPLNYLDEVVALFARQVYAGDIEAAQAHFDDHLEGGGATFLALARGDLVGYITIRWVSHNPHFAKENIPLIHDLAVFAEYRRRGIGTRLMDAAEALIATRATRAGITVGIFDEYGPAQRLYARRGYIPDGRGVCQAHRPLRWGDALTVDHDLIQWLTKDLRSNKG